MDPKIVAAILCLLVSILLWMLDEANRKNQPPNQPWILVFSLLAAWLLFSPLTLLADEGSANYLLIMIATLSASLMIKVRPMVAAATVLLCYPVSLSADALLTMSHTAAFSESNTTGIILLQATFNAVAAAVLASIQSRQPAPEPIAISETSGNNLDREALSRLFISGVISEVEFRERCRSAPY